MFYNLTPEFASWIGSRSVGERVKSAAASFLVDVLILGMIARMVSELDMFKEVKEAVGDMLPVPLNTSEKAENILKYIRVADGVMVGFSLKKDV
jgi:predicted TIM-barrel enzyme